MIVVYILAFVLLAVILVYLIAALLVNPKKEYDKESPLYRKLLNKATRIALCLCRVRVHTYGMEKIPQDTKCLFVSNHRSNFDPIVTWYELRKYKPAFVSKASNFKIPVFGRIIRKCCFMSIDREDPRKAMKAINHAAELLKNNEVSIGVYPEGTRSRTDEMLPFHNGVLKIAQKANAPIVVMSVSGTQNVIHNFPFKTSHIYLDILDVINPEEMKGVRTDVIGGKIRQCIENGLRERK